MNKSLSSPVQAKSIEQDINRATKSILDNKKINTENPTKAPVTKPLIRYFDIVEETTTSYVLGYN